MSQVRAADRYMVQNVGEVTRWSILSDTFMKVLALSCGVVSCVLCCGHFALSHQFYSTVCARFLMVWWGAGTLAFRRVAASGISPELWALMLSSLVVATAAAR